MLLEMGACAVADPESQLPFFAVKLKAMRRAAGLSQKSLAEKAGLHPMALAKLEQGQRGPAWETVQALAKALGVTCLEFTEGATEPVKPSGTKGKTKR